jgi:3-polyprenyl-4-hydroxybenzoate decarboxylase
VIAVDDDIDPLNADAVFWAMSYRCDPARDTQIVADREPGHGPRSASHGTLDSAMLIDATMKAPMPPLALPKRAFMEDARRLWESLGLPPLRPESPWFGYSLGDWAPEWDEQAMRAAAGGWASQDGSYRQRRRRDVAPNTPVRGAPPDSD